MIWSSRSVVTSYVCPPRGGEGLVVEGCLLFATEWAESVSVSDVSNLSNLPICQNLPVYEEVKEHLWKILLGVL